MPQRKPKREDTRRTAMRWLPIFLALAGITALYLPGIFAPAAGTFHDDGIYLGTAQALAGGDGYRIVSLPSEAVQTKYPPLFPVSLAAVWRLLPDFPSNLPALRLLTVFWTVLWCRFAYLLLRREEGSTTAAVIIVLTLCSPWVFFLATSLMSEALFATFTWAALFQFARYEDQRDEAAGERRLWLAAVLGGAAMLTRLLGACLIGACILRLLFRRRVRDALTFAVISAVLVMPWLVWAVLGSAGESYYAASNYASWNLITDFSWSETAAVLRHNLFLFFLTPGYLFGFFEPETIPLLLLLGALTSIGLVARMWTGFGVLDLFFVLYLFAIALWPWPPVRFVAPLYPLVLLLAWRGVETVWRAFAKQRLPGPVLRKATAVAAVMLAAATLGATSLSVIRTGMIAPAPPCQDDWAEFEQVLAWIETETSTNAILAANLDPVVFLYTGRKAVRPFDADPLGLYYSRSPDREPLGPPTELARRLRVANVDYLVTTPGSCFPEKTHLKRQLEALLKDDGGSLREVARFSPATRVYAVRTP